MGRETVKANYCIDNEGNLKGTSFGLELARFAWILGIVERKLRPSKECRHAPWAFCFGGIERGGIAKLPRAKFPPLCDARQRPRLRIRWRCTLRSDSRCSTKLIIAIYDCHNEWMFSEIIFKRIFCVQISQQFCDALAKKCVRSEIKTMPISRKSPLHRWAYFWLQSLVIGLFRSRAIFWRGLADDTCGQQIGKHVSVDLCVRETFVRFKRYCPI